MPRVAAPPPAAPSPPPVSAATAQLRVAVLAWYATRGRDLAFRATTDPYAILVSEAMAQQTQAARAAEYWTRFLIQFPTLEALATATPAAVLRAWRGLGYNRRALALRKAAIAIAAQHDGRVPDDLEALRRLPGVGPYTARAVAALAFGRRVGAVDVNVRRVLSRAIGGSLDAFGAAELQTIADASVPSEAPGLWTHALMDIGATFCKPRAPRCGGCPAAPWCRYAQASDWDGAADGDVDAAVRVVRDRPARFETTSRWLRGRLLDLLRDALDETWAAIPTSVGRHDAESIAVALDGLVRDGLAERHPADRRRARLPIA